MLRTSLLLVLSLAATAGQADELLITNVTVLSPDREAPLSHQSVRIRDGVIVDISDQVLSPATNTVVLDGSGRYLTPGLIDSHVHLYHASGLKRRYTADYDRLYDSYLQQLPRSYLYHGYTSLVELNADAAITRRIAASAQTPDILHCSQGLVLSNDFMATEFDSSEEFLAANPNFLHDRYTTPTLPAGYDPAQHTAAATVARIASDGGRCVKMYYEEALWWPGNSKPEFALPSEAIVKEVVKEAHQRGMTVLLHGTTANAQRLALATGVDVLAHGLWEWPGSRLAQTDLPAEISAVTTAVANSNVAVQPTLQTLRNELSLTVPDFLDNPALTKILPAAYLDYLRRDGKAQRQEFFRRAEKIVPVLFPEYAGKKFDLAQLQSLYISRYQQLIQRLQQQGGKLLFGTDTAVGGFGWGNPPGLNGYWEMQAWHEAGIPLATIFRAATLDNAKAFGLQNQLGTVAVGKQANLLLLDANPLRDIEAWNAIHTIVLHGKAIARDSLAANFRAVAVSELKIEPVAARPGFTARIWYPTSDTDLKSFSVSRIRAGYQAVANGRYTDETGKTDRQAPLIVLSHGSGGSADAMAWIGMELAKQGAIVVAADHPASSGGDAERASILELWQQPLDVSQLLDQLLDAKRHPAWAARIDAKRIAHVGFSLGGSTALMLAGAQLDLTSFGHFCQQQQLTKTMDGACRAFSHFLPQFDAGHFQRSHDNYRDPRIKASIAIAPGFTETLTSASVKNLTTPVLLLVAANDQQLPPASHIAPVREILPASVIYHELAGAQHFSLLPLCKPGAVALLAESHEEFVCQEVGNKSRAQIHLEALAAMQTFLQQQTILR